MDVNIAALAAQSAQYLLPCLPALLSSGAGKVADAFLQKVGEKGYEFASTLWARLRGQRAELDVAARDAAENAGNEDAAAAFRFQLKQLLAQNSDLAQEVARLVTQYTYQVEASGDRTVAVGRDINSSTIITGDHNQVGGREDEA